MIEKQLWAMRHNNRRRLGDSFVKYINVSEDVKRILFQPISDQDHGVAIVLVVQAAIEKLDTAPGTGRA